MSPVVEQCHAWYRHSGDVYARAKLLDDEVDIAAKAENSQTNPLVHSKLRTQCFACAAPPSSLKRSSKNPPSSCFTGRFLASSAAFLAAAACFRAIRFSFPSKYRRRKVPYPNPKTRAPPRAKKVSASAPAAVDI
eukprot:CAMPEP_0172198514 /NCGR_PEP_ID=MMETSP1050-20130122/28132_1 /TAXON_ID=233186 /ORGANISM="Cryptomonas curvata, Strain CCAP979/52" /LENGTH=134 /DNA_ID=CAMNT_0012875349 /DNA_START=53 /DNA_END=457 /DNA_ORIENTATION=+